METNTKTQSKAFQSALMIGDHLCWGSVALALSALETPSVKCMLADQKKLTITTFERTE
jgi:hypothetical protein